MTTDPFTTADEARACAWAEYRKDYQPNPSQLSAAHKAFVAGWEAARSYLAAQEPTDAEVEAAAEGMWDRYGRRGMWRHAPEHLRNMFLADARAALSAARHARGGTT